MLAEVTLRETAAVIGLRLQDQIPYDAFAFFDWDGAALHPLFVGGKHGDLFRGLKVPRREGLVGWVLENQKAIINGNPAVEPGYPQSAVHTLLSALAIPATTSDATQVVLALYRSNAEAFRDQELALARFLCSRVGLTVEETALPPSLTQVTPS